MTSQISLLREPPHDPTCQCAYRNPPTSGVLDLFCGAAGGWSLGLHRAGFKTIAACESDPWRRAVFQHNNPGVRMYDDVQTLTGDRLRADGLVPDIVVGSPPCQDASTANAKGKGIDGERTGLFLDYIRIVGELRPRWAAAENVPGLRARGADRVLTEMEALGYTGWPLVVGAVHAGANHLRKRVWFLWLRNDAADAASLGCGEGWAWGLDPGGAREPEQALHDADTSSVLGLEVEGRQPDGTRAGAAAYSDGIEPKRPGRVAAGRIEMGAGEGGATAADARQAGLAAGHEPGGAEPPLSEYPGVRALAGYRHWNGGAPDLGRVDDGVSAGLASRRGIGRACLAGFGDAVIPQITEAIGRTILTVDRLLSDRAAILEQMARAESLGAGADRLRGRICEKAAGDDLPGRRRPFLPLVPRLVLPRVHETETRTGAVR